MELRVYIEILKRRAAVIIIVAALTVAVLMVASLFITPIYSASATVRVVQDVGIQELSIKETYGDRLMNTYSRILKSWPILEEASERLTSPLSATQLQAKIKIEVIPNTELMKVITNDADPVFARDLANTLIDLLIEHVQSIYSSSGRSSRQTVEEQLFSIESELEQDREKLTSLLLSGASDAEIETVRSKIRFQEDSYNQLLDRYELARLSESLRANSVTVVSPALIPGSPANRFGLTESAIALIVGLFGGISLALVLENLDTRIHSPRQLERLIQLPVVGSVPKGFLPLGSLERASGSEKKAPLVEAYRLLGTNLLAVCEDMPFKSILVTSAMPHEGKTTVTVNLSQALAERGQEVYLVESDLRRPTIAKVLEVEDVSPGLAGLLNEKKSIDQASLKWYILPTRQPTLSVITGGAPMINPTGLLASPSMKELLHFLSAKGGKVLLDAPPVLGMADVSVLAPMVDGVVLIVQQAHTKREQVQAALKQLQASRARVIGAIFVQKGRKGWGYE